MHGLEGTTVDDIARDAGYTRGAFYANFANKEAVMRELIEHGFEGDLAGIESMHDDLDHAAARYGELARHFFSTPENTLWMLEFQLAAARHPELRGAYSEQFDRLRQAVGSVIRATYERMGSDQAADAEQFADVFIAVLSGLSLTRILDPEKIDPELFEQTFRALVRGIPHALSERT